MMDVDKVIANSRYSLSKWWTPADLGASEWYDFSDESTYVFDDDGFIVGVEDKRGGGNVFPVNGPNQPKLVREAVFVEGRVGFEVEKKVTRYLRHKHDLPMFGGSEE